MVASLQGAGSPGAERRCGPACFDSAARRQRRVGLASWPPDYFWTTAASTSNTLSADEPGVLGAGHQAGRRTIRDGDERLELRSARRVIDGVRRQVELVVVADEHHRTAAIADAVEVVQIVDQMGAAAAGALADLELDRDGDGRGHIAVAAVEEAHLVRDRPARPEE